MGVLGCPAIVRLCDETIAPVLAVIGRFVRPLAGAFRLAGITVARKDPGKRVLPRLAVQPFSMVVEIAVDARNEILIRAIAVIAIKTCPMLNV